MMPKAINTFKMFQMRRTLRNPNSIKANTITMQTGTKVGAS